MLKYTEESTLIWDGMQQKPQYITNKELLLEIHKSKKTFCYFVDDQYSNYDAIASSVEEITPEYAERILAEKNAKKRKDPKDVIKTSIDELVFRVMTHDHVPLCDDKKRRSRTAAGQGHLRTNFPPFKHFILKEGEVVEVGRSHWKNGLDNGEFSAEHGKVSRRLAEMWMLLVERYSRRGNWRNYCVDEETEALTKRGWLGFNEITERDTILSIDIEDGKLKWSKIKSIFRDNYDGEMFHLTVRGMDAMVTPGHRFFVKDYGLKRVEYLLETDKVVLMGDAVAAPEQPTYSDEMVELIGWVVTEGNFYERGPKSTRLTISQNEGEYADRIRRCLTALNQQHSEYKKNNGKNWNVIFSIHSKLTREITEIIGKDRVLPSDFILSLTAHQRDLLIETMIDADGWRTRQNQSVHVGYCQKDKNHMDSFLMLCTLAGRQVSVHRRDIVTKVNGLKSEIYEAVLFSNKRQKNNGKYSRVENIDMHGGKRSGKIKGRGKFEHPNEPTVPYRGIVWCPETEYGTFVSRRNGTIFTQGQTYNDEMRSTALLQLSQVGLVFDESKGDNPFAFYTTTIKNCLSGETMVLTREFGSVPIGEISEQDVHLLDGNGNWTKCHIYDHGVQQTRKNYFCRGGHKETVWSTANHGWISSGEKILTKEFSNRDVSIDDLRPIKKVRDVKKYEDGFVHGLIYGDGSYSGTAKNFFAIRVCSHHEEIEQWMGKYPKSFPASYGGDPLYYISNAWTNLKALPDNPGDDLDYLLGFFRGWFTADGCVPKNGTPTLCGGEKEYQWCKKWGPLVGWHFNNRTPLAKVTNFGIRKKDSVNMHLRCSSMSPDDFIVRKHRQRWEQKSVNRSGKAQGRKYDWDAVQEQRNAGLSWKTIAEGYGVSSPAILSAYSNRNKRTEQNTNWRVYKNRQPSETRWERVYCPVVTTTESFALSCGIHSSNCFTRVANVERKNQNIRDDILTMAGARPSYTRQIENELAHKFADQGQAKPAIKRGRKAKVVSVIPRDDPE